MAGAHWMRFGASPAKMTLTAPIVHDWAAGDLLIWDNLMLQHARLPFDSSEPRTLRRTPILYVRRRCRPRCAGRAGADDRVQTSPGSGRAACSSACVRACRGRLHHRVRRDELVNFAHGHVAMAAMFASFALNRYLGLDPYLAALCLFPVFLVVGALLYRIVDRARCRASPATQMLVTLGLLIVIENSANLIFGGDLRSVRSSIGEGSPIFAGLVLPCRALITAAGSLLAIMALWAFLKFTRFGMEIRAAANNELGARLVGIPIQRVFIQAFALATAMAAFAGAMLVPFYLINPFIGYDFMLKAFVISIIGGLGSLPGAFWPG